MSLLFDGKPRAKLCAMFYQGYNWAQRSDGEVDELLIRAIILQCFRALGEGEFLRAAEKIGRVHRAFETRACIPDPVTYRDIDTIEKAFAKFNFKENDPNEKSVDL